jgi:hypothetical protein
MELGDVRDFLCESHVTERVTRLATKDKHKDMIIAWNYNSQETRVLAQLIALIALMVEQKINLALYRIFFLLSTWKKRICEPLSQGFLDSFQNGIPPIFSIKLSTTKIKSSRSNHGMGTFSSSNSTKHHGKCFSNHTLMFIYQKLNTNKRVSQDKHHTRPKI